MSKQWQIPVIKSIKEILEESEKPLVKQVKTSEPQLESLKEYSSLGHGGKRPGAGRKPTRLYEKMAKVMDLDQERFDVWLEIGKLMKQYSDFLYYINNKTLDYFMKNKRH